MIVESSDSGHTHSICYHVTLTEFRTPEVRLQPAKNEIMILRHNYYSTFMSTHCGDLSADVEAI